MSARANLLFGTFCYLGSRTIRKGFSYMKSIAAVLLCSFSMSMLSAVEALSPEEQKQQNEFRKLASTGSSADRLKAITTLEGASHPTSRELLAILVRAEPDKDVRKAAFTRLSQMPARDPGLSMLLVNLFQTSMKPNDIALKMEFAEAFKNSEFKYAVCEALVDQGSKMRYQDIITWDRGNSASAGASGTIGGDPNVQIRKNRADFEKYIEIFNSVTKAKLEAKDKDSVQEFKKWWAANKEKVATADKEILVKYHEEDKKPGNPLVPSKKTKE